MIYIIIETNSLIYFKLQKRIKKAKGFKFLFFVLTSFYEEEEFASTTHLLEAK